MLTEKTINKIYSAQREIKVGEKLLKEVSEFVENKWNDAEKLKDSFGRERNLHLGIPSGKDSQRLFNVSYKLAESIIRVHITNKRAELKEANEIALIELQGDRDDHNV